MAEVPFSLAVLGLFARSSPGRCRC